MQNNPDMARLLRLAQSPAGQKLMGLLQQSGDKQVNEAMEKAAAGDYDQAKQLLSALLDSREAKELLSQLGGQL